MFRIAILVTCHNRCKKTKEYLKSLNLEKHPECQVYLVNDGCTDGTQKMVETNFKMVKILKGNGELYWNRGMHYTFSEAIKKNYDFYIWINDDVIFIENIIDKLLNYYLFLKIKIKRKI